MASGGCEPSGGSFFSLGAPYADLCLSGQTAVPQVGYPTPTIRLVPLD